MRSVHLFLELDRRRAPHSYKQQCHGFFYISQSLGVVHFGPARPVADLPLLVGVNALALRVPVPLLCPFAFEFAAAFRSLSLGRNGGARWLRPHS